MRLRVCSDIHLEFGPFSPPAADEAADVVVLAGDLANGTRGIDWILQHFPDTPVVLVLGNHDFYYESFSRHWSTLRSRCAGARIHLLENQAVSLAGYRFLGCTLWTDFALHGTPEVSREIAGSWMADYRCIDTESAGTSGLLTPFDTQALHRESRSWLAAELPRGDVTRTVVVTHHAPSARSLASDPSHSALNPAFGSNLDALVESSGVPLWIHGHTHRNVDYQIGATRVFSNQRGYPDESSPGFRPDGLLRL